MKATRCGWRLYLLVALGFLLVVLLAGCGGSAKVSAQIRRNLSNVYAGEGSPDSLPLLSDDEWHDLPDKSLITTDADGEGWLQINQCMLVYVFQNSGLVKAACPRSDYASGNVTCALEGTSAYNNDCSDKVVIQTLSAEVTLEGTWISITFLPEQQVTILAVFEGHATARPVRNAELRTMGEAVEIPTRHFWFSEPGVTADPIAGLAARQPHPFDQFPRLIQELHLQPWMERLRVRAEADKVPFFDLPAVSPTATHPGPPQDAPSPTPTSTTTPEPAPTGTGAPTATPTPAPQPECLVTASSLNLREGPSTQFSIVEAMANGSRFEGLERLADASWIFGTSARGLRGWASSSYLSCNYDLAHLPVATRLPPTYTPTPIPQPVVRFWADPGVIESGQRSTLRWQTENVQAAFLSGGDLPDRGVPGPSGSLEISPAQTTTYTLRAVLLDGRQETHTATVTVNRRTNTPPTVTITEPGSYGSYSGEVYDDSKGLLYKEVDLVARVTDPEDGVLEGESLVWRTDQAHIQEAVLGTGSRLRVRLYSDWCANAVHVITLTARDSDGNTSTAETHILIEWDFNMWSCAGALNVPPSARTMDK